MSTGSSPAALQEDLPLESTGPYEYSIDLEALGLDADLVSVLTGAGPLCFLDFEATGLSPDSDDLIEAGAILLEAGKSTARVFNTIIHTGQELTPFIRRLTGISQAQVADGAPMAEVAPALRRFIGQATVVAHNAAFERTFLTSAIHSDFGHHRYLDTVELLALVYPDSPNMKLDTFCRSKLQRRERHRALDDALDTARVVVNILAESRNGDPAAANALAALIQFNPMSAWRERLEDLPTSLTRKGLPENEASWGSEDALDRVAFDRKAIVDRLRDDEAARRVLPDFQSRPRQIDLMQRVFDCFEGQEGKSVVTCEAGTGIGKTLAYLAVAIPFARATGEQVIISTSSKVLQTQLLEKDIPAAAKLLGYEDLRFTSMKGRANYICRRRLDGFLAQGVDPASDRRRPSVALISAFANSAAHGEVDRIPSVLFQLNPELERYAREISSTDSHECSRADCESSRAPCVFRDARRRLEGAEIAVVNHDLLLRWPPDYPPLRHLILDEVHELVEKADRAYARSAEGVEITHRLEQIAGEHGAEPLLSDAGDRELAVRTMDLIAQFGIAAKQLVGKESSFQFARDEVQVPPDGLGPEITESALSIADNLTTLARRLSAAAEKEDSLQSSMAEALADAATVISDGFPYPNSDQWVFRLKGLARTASNSWRVVATPVSPAADFQLNVLDHTETLFATSATVSIGKDRTGAIRELELDERARHRFLAEPPLESPFDYERNLQVVFITDTTNPARLVDRTADAIATVAARLRGRTLGLFTARDRMLRVGDLLDQKLGPAGISTIAPTAGNADPHELVQTFVQTEQGILLGSRSFWQGVDIPGDACQAVVIEKLPFDVPGDPLLQRRAAIIEQDGGSAFGDQTLPRMLLRLKQMMGRLIRTPDDRGVIIVVESRADKSYFRRVLSILPPNARHVAIPLAELDSVVAEFFPGS